MVGGGAIAAATGGPALLLLPQAGRAAGRAGEGGRAAEKWQWGGKRAGCLTIWNALHLVRILSTCTSAGLLLSVPTSPARRALGLAGVVQLQPLHQGGAVLLDLHEKAAQAGQQD